MKRSDSLLKRTLTISLIVVMMSFILTASYATLTGKAEDGAPKWSNGDDWFYKVDRPEGQVSFTEKVTSEGATFKIDEESYSCYMVERTWDLMNGSAYYKKFYTKDSLAEVGQMDRNGKKTYFGEPLKRFDFPLDPGKNWEGNTLQYTQTIDQDQGEPKSKVNYTFEIVKKTEVKVEAGKFDAYMLNGTILNTDPQSPEPTEYGSYVHFYFSPEVKNYVKIVNYYEGQELGVQELHSYNVSKSNNSPFIGPITVGTAAITMVALYNIVKKKKED